MNKYEQIPECVVDLHGYTLREAERALEDLLDQENLSHVRIIVGKGNHSTGPALLREFAKSYLTSHRVRFTQSKIQDGGEGALEVFLS